MIKHSKNVPPFLRYCSATIPAMFDDSMSYYEALCALWKWLQTNLVDVVNNNAEVTEQYAKAVEELEKYVRDYFKNLDVQEEVNNKLDEMAESGELESIIGNYLLICGGNAKSFGAKGDGVTDDTESLQNAINTLSNNGINKLVIPSGTYVVSSKLEIPSNFSLVGVDGSVLKYVGMGADQENPYKPIHLIFIEGTQDSVKHDVSIENITIDCTSQIYKGGKTFDTPDNTNPQPISQGMQGIHIKWCKNVKVNNCKIKDLYGAGIYIHKSNTITIDGNTLTDVGGGNIIAGGATGYDNFGDAIASFSSFNIKFINNTIINQRKYKSGASIGKICGRSGMEFEYSMEVDNIPCPDRELFSFIDGHGLIMDNNYVYGYTKGIHLEASVACQITNNTLVHNNIGLMNTTNGKCSISNNYFNSDNVGKAYQSGYDQYYCGVAVSEYVATIDSSKCVEITSNIFDGDSSGVIFGRNYVTISSNTFRGNGIGTGCIRSIKENLRGIVINANELFNCSMNLYKTTSVVVSDNAFYNIDNYCIRAEGCSNTVVKGNDFNQRVVFISTTYNTSVTDNNFYAPSSVDSSYTYMLQFSQTATNSVIEGNNINLIDNNDITFLIVDSSKNTIINNNNIRITTDRTAKVVYVKGGGTNIQIDSNCVSGCGYKASIFESNWDINGFKLTNNYLDEPISFIYKQTGGGIVGSSKIEHNIGNVSVPTGLNNKNALNNRFLQQGEITTFFTISGNVAGVYCSQGGFYTTTNWTSGTSYAVKKLVANNGYVYRCITAGTSTTVPTTTVTGDEQTTDDGLKWVCTGKLATLRDIILS